MCLRQKVKLKKDSSTKKHHICQNLCLRLLHNDHNKVRGQPKIQNLFNTCWSLQNLLRCPLSNKVWHKCLYWNGQAFGSKLKSYILNDKIFNALSPFFNFFYFFACLQLFCVAVGGFQQQDLGLIFKLDSLWINKSIERLQKTEEKSDFFPSYAPILKLMQRTS